MQLVTCRLLHTVPCGPLLYGVLLIPVMVPVLHTAVS